MKRTLNSDSKKKGGVKWDEDNLEQNEIIKQALNPIKINEPKTPYLSPMETDEEFDIDGAGMSPLSLEDDGPPTRRSPGNGLEGSKTSSPSSTNGGSAGSSPGWRQPSPRFNDFYREDSDTVDTGSDDSEQAEKRRKFMELRKQHYNMKEALKHLSESTDEDEGGGAEEEVEAAKQRGGEEKADAEQLVAEGLVRGAAGEATNARTADGMSPQPKEGSEEHQGNGLGSATL